jgi:CBS domain-containing membrane protein
MNGHPTTTPVHEVMTPAPITVTESTTVAELMAAFDRYDFNAFPVLDGEGRLAGIVTKLDVLRLFRPAPGLRIPEQRAISLVPVERIMRRGILNVEADDPLVTAAELMVATRLRSLPVVRRGPGRPMLVGIVTQGDLLRGLRFELADQGMLNQHVE